MGTQKKAYCLKCGQYVNYEKTKEKRIKNFIDGDILYEAMILKCCNCKEEVTTKESNKFNIRTYNKEHEKRNR